MKRDDDLIREIALALEASDHQLAASSFADSARPEQFVAYQIDLMAQAGLIRATIDRDLSGTRAAFAVELTNKGQDFVAAARNDKVWSETKRHIAKTAGAATLDTLTSVAAAIGTKLIMGALQ